jgi:hypothetical protein
LTSKTRERDKAKRTSAADMELSQRRADSVAQLLIHEGVSPAMLSAKGERSRGFLCNHFARGEMEARGESCLNEFVISSLKLKVGRKERRQKLCSSGYRRTSSKALEEPQAMAPPKIVGLSVGLVAYC